MIEVISWGNTCKLNTNKANCYNLFSFNHSDCSDQLMPMNVTSNCVQADNSDVKVLKRKAEDYFLVDNVRHGNFSYAVNVIVWQYIYIIFCLHAKS